LLQAELERDMKLMGCTSIKQLNRNNLRFRWNYCSKNSIFFNLLNSVIITK
jgi:hypothetical protein